MHQYEGTLRAPENLKVGIVVARFNEMITRSLLQGALDTLRRYGVSEENVTVAWVPGVFEMPLVAKTLAKSDECDAVIGLGAVIRGATAHFDYVAGPAASGLSQAALDTETPVIFGVLTTDTIEQAIERSGTKAGNKGSEAATTAIEMADLMGQLAGKAVEARS